MSALTSKNTLLIILIILLIFGGCQDKQPDLSPVRYSIPVLDSCENEQDHKYFISKPEIVLAEQKIPLIIVIDPHGDGKFALEQFTRALVDIPAVIIGSAKLKNNNAGFELSLSHLYNDVLVKYPVSPDMIIVAGFSGGARMAFAFGMRHRVMGIIMFGAGPGSLKDQMMSKRIYAVSGTRDYNFMEQYLPPFSLLGEDLAYTADFFRGKHEWPPSKYIYESVAYTLKDELNYSSNSLAAISERLMQEYDSLLQSDDLFFAGKALEKALAFTNRPKNMSRISREIEHFRNTPEWIDYNKKFQSYLQKELKLKQAYASKLADPDTAWWKNEINSLNQNILSCSDQVQEDFFYRVQGFIGIVLYSRINTLLQNNVLSRELNNLLVIYEYAEPESQDLLYFKSEIKKLTKR